MSEAVRYCYLNMSFWHAKNAKFRIMSCKGLNNHRGDSKKIHDWAQNLLGDPLFEKVRNSGEFFTVFKRHRGSKKLDVHAIVTMSFNKSVMEYKTFQPDGSEIDLGQELLDMIKPSDANIPLFLAWHKFCKTKMSNLEKIIEHASNNILSAISYCLECDHRIEGIEGLIDNSYKKHCTKRSAIGAYHDKFGLERPVVSNLIGFVEPDYSDQDSVYCKNHVLKRVVGHGVVHVSKKLEVETNCDKPQESGTSMFLLDIEFSRYTASTYRRWSDENETIVTDGEKFFTVIREGSDVHIVPTKVELDIEDQNVILKAIEHFYD